MNSKVLSSVWDDKKITYKPGTKEELYNVQKDVHKFKINL